MEKPKRLLALDVFRGLTIALMIVVNNPGSGKYVYAPLKHSHWNGCTPTDLVFPFFLFIMGAAMWYSFKKLNHTINRSLVVKILRRTVLIFLIGMAINIYAPSKFDFGHVRIMGVLNRIALAYGISAFIVLGLRIKWIKIATATILLGYWALLVVFGGDSPFTLEGNFAGVFDKFVLGANHLPGFRGYKLFDQTGLLSTLPALGNVLLGYFAGRLIEQNENKMVAIKWLFIYGIAGVIIAQIWNLVFPINKPLWTSSFVLYTSGLAMILLGIFLWIIDIKGYKKWTHPLQVFGMNPLFIYVLSIFGAVSLWKINVELPANETIALKPWIYEHIFVPIAGNLNGSLLYAITLTTFCWFIGWILYRKRIFIKI